MKKLFTTLSLGLSFMSAFAGNLDLAPSNLSSNIYFDKYNAQTKTIEGIHFMILENDGSSTLNQVPAFTVNLYLYKSSTEYYFIKTFNVNDFHEMSARTFGDYDNGQARIDIDISTLSNVPSNTYKLGVYVDADEQITETNENNNAILFSDNGSFDYTKGVVVVDKPDLTILSKTYTYDGNSESLQNIKVNVKNQGALSASSSSIKIEIIEIGGNNATTSSTQSVGVIAPGSTTQVSLNNVDLTQLMGFNTNGTYKMIITVDSGNALDESDENNNTNTENPINFSTTGIEFLSENFNIKVPNPVSGEYLNGLSTLNSNIQSVQVYSLTGSLMNVENLADGMYLVKINTAKGSVTQKMVVE